LANRLFFPEFAALTMSANGFVAHLKPRFGGEIFMQPRSEVLMRSVQMAVLAVLTCVGAGSGNVANAATAASAPAPTPKLFAQFSKPEMQYACGVFFDRSSQFQLESIKRQPDDVNRQKTMRVIVGMKIYILAASTAKVADERAKAIAGVMPDDFTEFAPDVLDYCVGVSSAIEAQMKPSTKDAAAQRVDQELRVRLKEAGVQNWQSPP
jgi:hypothetical protein